MRHDTDHLAEDTRRTQAECEWWLEEKDMQRRARCFAWAFAAWLVLAVIWACFVLFGTGCGGVDYTLPDASPGAISEPATAPDAGVVSMPLPRRLGLTTPAREASAPVAEAGADTDSPIDPPEAGPPDAGHPHDAGADACTTATEWDCHGFAVDKHAICVTYLPPTNDGGDPLYTALTTPDGCDLCAPDCACITTRASACLGGARFVACFEDHPGHVEVECR